MNILEPIVNAIFNIFGIYINFRIINLFMKKRDVPKYISGVIYFLVWIMNWGIYYLYDNDNLTTTSLAIMLLLATIVLYEGTFFRKIVAVCSVVALSIAVEDIVWMIFMKHPLSVQGDEIGILTTSLVMIVITLFLERFFRFDKAQYISKESYFNILIVLLGNIILVCIMEKVFVDNSSEILLALCIICLMDISTFYLYDRVNEAYRQKFENGMTEERISLYENQLEIITQNQENMNTLRHDMKNHLFLLKSYIDAGNYKEADQYIQEIGQYMEFKEQYVKTDNSEIDMILNYAIGRAKHMGCEVETQIQIPDSCLLPGFDLNMLLGNLLDNALEALERTEHRYLYIGMHFQKNILLIQICNSFDGIIHKKGDLYVTRKASKQFHGFGMKSIHEIVKKYNGEQVIESENGMFKTDIILYLE